MAQQSFLDKVREWIGGLAWSIFLWSARMTEEEYFAELDSRSPTLRAPVHAAIELLYRIRRHKAIWVTVNTEWLMQEVDAVLKTAAGG